MGEDAVDVNTRFGGEGVPTEPIPLPKIGGNFDLDRNIINGMYPNFRRIMI